MYRHQDDGTYDTTNDRPKETLEIPFLGQSESWFQDHHNGQQYPITAHGAYVEKVKVEHDIGDSHHNSHP